MQNQAAVEALYSATFVEDYLDYVENVPDDIQRFHTMLRELDLRQHQVWWIDNEIAIGIDRNIYMCWKIDILKKKIHDIFKSVLMDDR